MIHDSLLILWDCTVHNEKSEYLKASNDGDVELFGHICTIAKYHHRIQNFIEDLGFYSRTTRLETLHRSTGLYAQALSEGMTEVLQSYKQTLLDVERMVVENHSLTLAFIYSHVEKYRGLFHSLNNIITIIKRQQLNGCQLLCLVHQHILTGNEVVHENILKIFANINKVFITQLCCWLLYGELKDVNNEFFIYRIQQKEESCNINISSPSHADIDDKTHTSSDLETESGHKINPNMIPNYLPLSLAQEILFIGKIVILFGFDPSKVKRKTQILNNKLSVDTKRQTGSRRFTIWEEKEAIFHEKLQNLKGTNFEICDLRIVIREIKECVTKHLWFVVVEEGNLLHEFRLMKDFYLVGRGELFLELLRRASHLLEGPITRTSTRDMNQAFQSAARAVFLSNNPDIEKFSFHLPYSKPNSTLNYTTDEDSSTVSEGWSGVELRYARTWPLHAVFTSGVLARYNRMFRLLLRIKNTQHNLHALWNTYKHSTSFPAWQLHNKLMFLVDNLQHYLQADVLETNFCKLMEVAASTRDFEVLKQAHLNFLDDILSQSFLTITEAPESDQFTGYPNIDNPVFNNITELLKLCDAFCAMSDDTADLEEQQYYLTAYTERFNRVVKQLMQLLVSYREHPSGIFLARLLMRLDYNRWLSGEAQLTQSVTNMLIH